MTTRPPRILGVDPGSTITGFAVIDGGARPVAVVVDCIRLPKTDFPARLGLIFTELSAVIEAHGPDELAIENVFVARNASSALKLGQARGAAICAATAAGLSVAEYSPNAIKRAIVGRGHAQKQQIQHMVRLLLGLAQPPQADAADGAAVALCHAHHAQTASRRAPPLTAGRA